MMKIDRMSYIFGSFTRRRQSQEINSAKRRSIEPTKISHDRSKSTPHTPKKIVPASPRAKSVCSVSFDDSKFKCSMCRRHFLEPRVLPCLHTFCLRCLEELEKSQLNSTNNDDDFAKTSKSRVESEGSDYISDKNTSSRDSCSSTSRKQISCPTCEEQAEVPHEGVATFPPNYLLQHRMVLATLNAQNTHLLCDLCTSDTLATYRCMECALSYCDSCKEIHIRQITSPNHEVLRLDEARKKGITKIRRQIMCLTHPDTELTIFCSSCCQVICRNCISVSHKGHPCEPVSRAVKSHLTNLRIAAEKAKSIAQQSALAANRLHVTSKKIETQCNKIQADVDKFIENYIKSVEEHKNNLYDQINETKQNKLLALNEYKVNLHKRVKDARDLAFFLEDLLSDGTDVEVMSFFKSVMDKIELCNNLNREQDLCLSESMQFLPEEFVQDSKNLCPLYGVITSQTVSPSNCILNTDGFHNLRVGKRTEVILETRDQNNTKLERGGEQVSGEIKYRDAGVSRFLDVDVEDKRDGSYNISFVPDVSGKLILSVYIRNQPIKDSPFPFVVRTLKPHYGTFHCCSFCSSGGSKEASCGCSGKMPGGYKGCGHGHDGHPGRRHWSCCGNVLEHSECTRINSHYQFTL